MVLSSQRTGQKDALYTVAKGKDRTGADNPLVQNGQKLIPSVTRVFTRGQDLYVYLQAYEQRATSMQPLVAYVAFYRNQAKVFETPPEEVTDGWDNELRTVPLRFGIPLSQIQPGKYVCQVTVLDPNGHKGTFWRAPIMLLP